MRRFQARALTVVLVFALLLVARAAWNVSRAWSSAAAKRDDAKTAQVELEMRKAALEAEIASLRTARGRDEAYREKFPVAKPGERVLLIVDEATSTGR